MKQIPLPEILVILAMLILLVLTSWALAWADPTEDLYYLALVVALEAEGEPTLGKEAVAWVVMNRVKSRQQTVRQVVMASGQFPGLWVPRRVRWIELAPSAFQVAWAVYTDQTPDPSHGATHYLNERTVLALHGRLPMWFDESRITARIGNHTFLRLDR